MKVFALVVAAVALTVICWGVYGPVLHKGQQAMEGSRLRALLCVGMAYFVIAVVAPIAVLWTSGEQGSWSVKGVLWSSAAGAAGAIGALGIILAFNFGGHPRYVMPLVFGCAPVVNAFLTIYWAGTWKEVNPLFLAGLILVAVGGFTVLFCAPPKGKEHASPAVEHAAPANEEPARTAS